MTESYVYVGQLGSKIISRGYKEDGSRFIRKEDYNPSLFTYSSKADTTTEWTDLWDRPVYEINPGNIKDCRDYIIKYKDVEGFSVLGNTNWYIQYISDTYPDHINVDMNCIRVNYIDIETSVHQGGFKDDHIIKIRRKN